MHLTDLNTVMVVVVLQVRPLLEMASFRRRIGRQMRRKRKDLDIMKKCWENEGLIARAGTWWLWVRPSSVCYPSCNAICIDVLYTLANVACLVMA